MVVFPQIDPRLQELASMIYPMLDNGSHGIPHIEDVMHKSIHIGTKERANLKTVLPAAMLHDLSLHFDGTSQDHSVKSGKLSWDYLSLAGYDDFETPHIIHCIIAHNIRYEPVKPKTLEAKVLIDADTLAKLSIERAHLFMKERKMDELAFAKNWSYIRRKLLAKNKLFYTQTGKQLGLTKIYKAINYWENRVAELEREWIMNELRRK